MPQELVKKFESLWELSDSPPDPFAFLVQEDASDSTDKLAVLLQDQQHRWKTDQPLKVEEYLSRLPELASDFNIKLQLAINEFQARYNGETSSSIDEFTSRFPDLGDVLHDRLSELVSDKTVDQKGKFISPLTYLTDTTVGDQQIGRYNLVRVLGEGAFGRVYLGFDEELQRQVAIKVPTAERFQKPEDAEAYLAEGRIVASLDHPNIVPVHDVGRTDDGSIYIVSKFIEGGTLDERVKQNRPDYDQCVTLIATIARALQHAHEKRLIHRDVKPSNILIDDATGTPYVADFGLAIREEDFLKDNRIAGTPAYMSPEQARGEGHRLDGRSDVFSLGIVFYELLTGKKPFRGSTANELLHQIVSVDPSHPRELDDSIPAELERICLKALSKKTSGRYLTAADFAGDLLQWNQIPEQDVKELKVIPKGLRSFGANDSDFFLDLLPGPRNRHGLPESIQFWKTRIEETDSDKTFSVGLIYGPSGCGKSSLVNAGLLPRLSEDVSTVYVEATPDETETRILRGLRKQYPELSDDLGLTETFTFLRRSEGCKTVIVIDQFEQWLHAHSTEQETELVSALRQCDGGTLQAVVMVRDDFAMAASRFMDSLDVPILQGHNFATVDLFDVDHAQKVLIKFGQAFGKLPAQTGSLTDEEKEFVISVATGLANDDKVVSVRLSLFAEMVKGKPWIPATLDEVSGTEGVGVNFLEETFSNRTANPKHRQHQQAAREVLKGLLPEVGSDIKGHMRSHAELLEASGYQSRPTEFNDLLRILDGELRLITPTDPEGFQSKSSSDPNSKYYQLTHDYLVPSLRDWLTRKQKETRRGRAELKLEERAALWNAKPENRHLPSLWEWGSIRTLTETKRWSEPQRNLMQRAGRLHGVRSSVALAVFLVASVVGVTIRQSILEDRAIVQARNTEQQNLTRADGLVESLLKADIAQVPSIIDDMKMYRRWVNPKLTETLDNSNENSKEHLHSSLAILSIDTTQLPYLKDRLLNAQPEQVATIVSLLENHKDEIIADLWRVTEKPDKGDETQLIQAASALAVYDTDNEERWGNIANRVVDTLVNENSLRVAVWVKTLQPARRHLVQPLGVVYRSKSEDRSQTQIDLATEVLRQYAADDLTSLAELLFDAEPKQFMTLFDGFAAHGGQALSLLDSELDRTLTFHWNDPPLDPSWSEPTAEVRGKINEAKGMITERFAFCQTMPLAEFEQVAGELRKSGYRPIRLRPYAYHNSVHIAAAWTRDGRDWRMESRLTADEIQQQDEQQRQEGFAAVDIAGYVGESDGSSAELYSALWMKKRDKSEDARIYAGASLAEHQTANRLLGQDGYKFMQSLQGFRGLNGMQKYSGVRTKKKGGGRSISNQTSATFDAKEYFDKILWDIDLNKAAKQTNIALRYEKLLGSIDMSTNNNTAPQSDIRLQRAEALLYLYRPNEAVDELAHVIASDPKSLSAYRLRIMANSMLANDVQATVDLESLDALGIGDDERHGWNAVISASQGKIEDVDSHLDSIGPFQENGNIDVLRLLDLQTAFSNSDWEKSSRGLVSPVGVGAKLELPVVPPAEYTLRITVTPEPNRKDVTGDGFMIGLVMEGQRFQATLDYSQLSALENLDGESIGEKNPTTHQGIILPDGVRTTVECKVGSGAVTISCDGQSTIDWQGESTQLTQNFYWQTPNPKHLYIGAYKKRYTVHSIILTPTTGVPVFDNGKLIDNRLDNARWHARVSMVFENQENLVAANKYWSQTNRLVSQSIATSPTPYENYRVLENDSILGRMTDAAWDSVPSESQYRYESVWQENNMFESLKSHGLSPTEHLAKCRQMQAKGYRLTAITAASVNGDLVTASVWHRPLIPDEEKELLAKRQSNAAVAALRLGESEKVWLLLKHSPDPRLRTWIIHRLSPLGASPEPIIKRLEEEQDVSIRRALIQILGESQEISQVDRKGLSSSLLELYRDDPDPGIHGAAGWVLQRWSKTDDLVKIDNELATGKVEGQRHWFLTQQRHTMVVIPGPVEFLMGSPAEEKGHRSYGQLHRKRIGRSFAIASKEVTVKQFQEFLRNTPSVRHSYSKQYASEENCPQNSVTWYQAAAYCRWLSEQEGIAEDQMCYPPIAEIKAGMKLPADYLSRTGYRLPSEAEWEYACRSKTTTSRHYGQSEELLGRYAWFVKTSKIRTWPVGSLKPNDAGLFDMHGNVNEWCQERYVNYIGSLGSISEDREDNVSLVDSSFRMVRGGSFHNFSSSVRSATRVNSEPSYRNTNTGFRPARTYHLSP